MVAVDVSNGGPKSVPVTRGDGVSVGLQKLVKLAVPARRVDLASLGSPRSQTMGAGPFPSPFRERGVEFDEVRAPFFVVADLGLTMHFGTRGCFKSVQAARVAALLMWAARHAGHPVGGVVSGPERIECFTPEAGLPGFLRLLGCLATSTGTRSATGIAEFSDAIARLRSIAPSGSRVFVVSDFHELDDESLRRLNVLRQSCDVECVQIFDPLEAKAPPPSRYRVTDGDRVATFETACRGTRGAYMERFRRRGDLLRDWCLRAHVPLLSIRTDDDPVAALEGPTPSCGGASRIGGRGRVV